MSGWKKAKCTIVSPCPSPNFCTLLSAESRNWLLRTPVCYRLGAAGGTWQRLYLYQASVVCGKVNKNSNGRIFEVFVAAIARLDEESRQSPLLRRLKFSVKVLNLLCSCKPLASSLLTDTESLRFKACVVVDRLRMFFATEFEQIMQTSSLNMAYHATGSHSKKWFRVKN